MLFVILIILFIIGCILINSIHKEGFECSSYTCSSGYINSNPSKSCGAPPAPAQYIEAPNYPQNANVASFCPAGTTFQRYSCGSNAQASLLPGGSAPQYGPYTTNDMLQAQGACANKCNCNNLWIQCQNNAASVPPTCTSDICCTPTCASISCDNEHTNPDPQKQCSGPQCTSDECCAPKPTCTSFSCGSRYTPKPNPASITCLNPPCTDDVCCIKDGTCSGYICPKKTTLKDNPNNIFCPGTCGDSNCCKANPNCDTHVCTSDYYYTRASLPNSGNIICESSACTNEECCLSTPTGMLPKIDVWPLYP